MQARSQTDCPQHCLEGNKHIRLIVATTQTESMGGLYRALRVMRISLLAGELQTMRLSSSGALLSGAASSRLFQLVTSVLTLLFTTSSIVSCQNSSPLHHLVHCKLSNFLSFSACAPKSTSPRHGHTAACTVFQCSSQRTEYISGCNVCTCTVLVYLCADSLALEQECNGYAHTARVAAVLISNYSKNTTQSWIQACYVAACGGSSQYSQLLALIRL